MPQSVLSFSCPRFIPLCLLAFTLIDTTSSDLQGLDHVYPVAPGDTRTPLTLGLMLSFSGDYVNKGAIPGIQLAVDTINRVGVLPGYVLEYSLTDSKVSRSFKPIPVLAPQR